MGRVDVFAELRKALELEKDMHKADTDINISAFVYAYTVGYQAALQYMEQDINLIEQEAKRAAPGVLISAEDMAELIRVNMKLKAKDEASDPDTPGYVIACEELLVYMQDLDTYELP